MSIAFRVIIEDQPLGYHPALAHICGGLADGVLLGRLLYWDGIMARKYGKKYSGEFYKSDTELCEETGLSRSEIKTAKRHLKTAKFITIKVRGVPPTSHYHLEIDNLQAAIERGEPVRSSKRAHGERGRFTPKEPQLATDGQLNGPQMVNQDTTKWRDIQNTTRNLPEESGETKNVSLPSKEENPKVKSAATQKALAVARDALKEWERKNDEERERGDAIADPRKAKQVFVKEFSPQVAKVFGRDTPIGEDRGATGDIFEFHCDREWLAERLTAYSNGAGDEYRRLTKDGRKPVAYWLRDRIEREWAEYRQEKQDAEQHEREQADYERRCAAALAGDPAPEQESGGAHSDSVHLHDPTGGSGGNVDGDEAGQAGIAVAAGGELRVRGDGLGVLPMPQPPVGATDGPGEAPEQGRSVREMYRDYKMRRHLAALDAEIPQREQGQGGAGLSV